MYKLMCKDKEVLIYNTIINTVEVINENLLHPGFSVRVIRSFKDFLEYRDTSHRVSDIDHYWLKHENSNLNYDTVKIKRRYFSISDTEKMFVHSLNWENYEQLNDNLNLFRIVDIHNSYMNDPILHNKDIIDILDNILGKNNLSDDNTGAVYDSNTGRFICSSPLCWRYSGMDKQSVANNNKYEINLVLQEKFLTSNTYINRINKLGIKTIDASKFASTIDRKTLLLFEKEQRDKYPTDLFNALQKFIEGR